MFAWSGKRDSTGLALQLSTLGTYVKPLYGAGKEIRTLDPRLGKAMLYH